jgi:hypothetical protein
MKFNKILSLVSVLLLLVVFASCQAEEPEPEAATDEVSMYMLYENDELGISLGYPNGVCEVEEINQDYFLSDKIDSLGGVSIEGCDVRIKAYTNSHDLTLDEWVLEYRNGTPTGSGLLGEFEDSDASFSEHAVVEGLLGCCMTYFRTYFIDQVDEDKVYTISFGANTMGDDPDAVNEYTDSVLESIKLY